MVSVNKYRSSSQHRGVRTSGSINSLSTIEQNHLDQVVKSVTDATKRLSQQESTMTGGGGGSGAAALSKTPTLSTASNNSKNKNKRRTRDTVGPWKLGKTLGKGSSGRVRLAKNIETGKLAAIKIVPKNKKFNNQHRSKNTNSNNGDLFLSYSSIHNTTNTHNARNTDNTAIENSGGGNPYGIEREIVIMKLLSHPNVMALYEVWENNNELYLVLEYVDGGELFDYLVSKGKLTESEAVHYFKQIINGISYCHSFNICHRDLKPENLLLDKKRRIIKIADFGMAALQVSNRLLQTSCGSPHYASPEIVMGKCYNGAPSDIWSCGIILFALLTGHLPFNDDNIKKLLIKVQNGRYQMPSYISQEAKNLISRILVVDPSKRISTEQILSHPLLTKYDKRLGKKDRKVTKNNKIMHRGKSNSDLNMLSNIPQNTEIVKLRARSDIDESILKNLQILWHGISRDIIIAKLLQTPMSEEKLIYSLLWKYKQINFKSSKAPSISSASVNISVSAQDTETSTNTRTNSNSATDISIPFVNTEPLQFNKINPVVTIDTPVENDAPKILQKAQFSLHSLPKSGSESEKDMQFDKNLPPALPPVALPIFPVSSSKVFKKSSSTISIRSRSSLQTSSSIKGISPSTPKHFLHLSPSNRSLIHSPSMKRMHVPVSERRTLVNSESKRSLYSLQSISKRSLNLNEFLKENESGKNEDYTYQATFLNSENLPPLPKLDSEADFETICNQLLFSDALDKILEEEESSATTKKDKELSVHLMESENVSEHTIKATIEKFEESSLEKNDITERKDSVVFDEIKNSFVLEAARTIDEANTIEESEVREVEKKRSPLQDLTNNYHAIKNSKQEKEAIMVKPNLITLAKFPEETEKKEVPVKKEYNIRAASTKIETVSRPSLDPRRNFTNPTSDRVESLLKNINAEEKKKAALSDKAWFESRIKVTSSTKEPTKAIDLSQNSISKLYAHNEIYPENLRNDRMSMAESRLISFDHISNVASKRFSTLSTNTDMSNPSVLAHSSTIKNYGSLLEMPKSFKTTSTTFKDLSEFLVSDESVNFLELSKSGTGNIKKSPSLKKDISMYSALSIPKLEAKAAFNLNASHGDLSSVRSLSASDRDVSDMTYAREIPSNIYTAQAIKLSAGTSEMVKTQILSYDEKETDSSLNKFEDAPTDSNSIGSSMTSSSISRSALYTDQKVYKKAVSIDTLNTPNILTPATDVRVSLYVNNNLNSNLILPRETTEEILSKFKLTPEKTTTNEYVQKRYSMVPVNDNENSLALSHSVISMFKDLEEEMDQTPTKENVQSTMKIELHTNDDNVTKPNRVTMLFDDDFVPSGNNGLPEKNEWRNKANDLIEQSEDMLNQEHYVANKDQEITNVSDNNIMKEGTKNETNNLLKPKFNESDDAKREFNDVNKAKSKPVESTSKNNWFSRLFSGFKVNDNISKKLVRDHVTNISFDLVNSLTLKEFSKYNIEYKLKNLHRTSARERVEYDCKFLKGNFKFKIKIEGIKESGQTIVTLKKKSKLSGAHDTAFEKFDQDVDKLIRDTERRIALHN
ncbi:hypothetical protein Kpol_431p9 [Vanderwaltozyma polyspora DSM 70294]|uniref:Protein kinase domain-containing protein n=1 Tax=Vanderwaltozyma polyspora (strain ATCC 22028 / DSM 70294 / BCRC 21397 / CBS 2163 / NBRC 10782 / NRRL Y-8283 / UCD 57-17) TaxID=436907 RepID=A7TRN0_VANPO|nr:uncharacterized protein Kpol_431p9 [Vanderwaltozyma polyspora DSM 70294]EDO15082.1 hypothetical protein Kpol_431p9 [Vanderwaltozyma polyspora DSM 70294]